MVASISTRDSSRTRRAAAIAAGWSRAHKRHLLPLFLAAMALVYCAAYLGTGNLPGNSDYPLAWWGWWDQSQYLRSALALASGQLDAAQHWYPLGYPVLAVPFVRFAPQHAFFFADLVSFVATAGLLAELGRQLGIGRAGGATAFVVGAVLPRFLLEQWVVPWSSTPVAVFSAGVFVCHLRCVADGVSPRRFATLAALVAGVLVTRFIDVLPLLPAALHATLLVAQGLFRGGATRRQALRSIAAAALATGVLLGAFGLLYASIYGLRPSPYMERLSELRIDPAIIPFRWLMIFADPRPFYGEGAGVLEHYPLVMLGLFGLVYATLFVRRALAIALGIWLGFAVYLAYVDFQPTGIWRFMLIHYWKGLFPLLAVVTGVALRDILVRRRWWRPAAAAGLLIPLVALRLTAEATPASLTVAPGGRHLAIAAAPGVEVAAFELRGIEGAVSPVRQEEHALSADGRTLQPVSDFRLVRGSDAVYLVFDAPRTVRRLELDLGHGVAAGSHATAYALSPRLAWRNPLRTRRATEAQVPKLDARVLGPCPGERPRRDVLPTRDSEFIRLAYRVVLSRAPDRHGFALACEQLGNGSLSRDELIERLTTSLEFQQRRR